MSADMNEIDHDPFDEKLDETLRHHFAAEFDGQLGRSRATFERYATTRTARAALQARRPRRISGARVWVIGVAGTALAASLAAVWAVPLLRNPGGTPIVNAPNLPAVGPSTQHGRPTFASAGEWQPVRQVTSEATLDQGAVVVDGAAPARVLRNVSIERTEWFDATRNVRVETTVPHEQVMLIGVDTY